MTKEHELERGNASNVMRELKDVFVPELPADNIANARALVAFLVSASMDNEPPSPDLERGYRLVFSMLDIVLMQIEAQLINAGPVDLPKRAAAD